MSQQKWCKNNYNFDKKKYIFSSLKAIKRLYRRNFYVRTFPKEFFPSGNFPNVQFPKWQLPKSVIAATQRCLSHGCHLLSLLNHLNINFLFSTFLKPKSDWNEETYEGRCESDTLLVLYSIQYIYIWGN